MGDILFDRYRICKSLGKGSFGEVYLVWHTGLHVYRAVKCISKSHALYDMAYKEADILKNLRHPGIPIIYDIIEDDKSVFIIEEFMSGQSLSSFLHNRKNISTRFIVNTAVRICEIVEYLHSQNVYHLDLKPDNILINSSSLRIIDYGSSKYADNHYGKIYGTKGYAAPEMYNYGNISAGSDIYSIGVILLYLCTGSNGVEAREHIASDELKSIIDRCTSHNTGERYNSVAELRKSLISLLTNPKVSDSKTGFIINFTGAQPHIGTTHSALMLQSALESAGLRCLLRECNSSHDIASLIRQGKRVHFKSGVYKVDGRYLAVNYNNKINFAQTEMYDVIINDYGFFNQSIKEEIINADMVVIVTGPHFGELINYQKCIKEIQNADPIVFINFTNAFLFKKILYENDIKNAVRVPYNVEQESGSLDTYFIEQRLGVYEKKGYGKKKKSLHNSRDCGNRT